MRRLGNKRWPIVALAAGAVFVAGCGGSSSGSGAAGSGSSSGGNLSGTLNASGSTFQATFQQTAIQHFRSVQPRMTVNYGGGGSGKGRTDLASRVVNFAGSDSPIPSSEQSTFHGTVLYFPVVIGPITVSYNLSGVNDLKLDPKTIAEIFEAKITNWNNSAIAADNPGAHLPSMPITVARRSDSSGTTQNFSQFLVDAAPGVWTLGTSSTINWPAASRGGSGNGGVSQIIHSTPGAIGYVDFADAKGAGLHYAAVKNQEGKYVLPTVESATAAADGADIAPNLTFSAIWAKGADSYPITYQSWVLAYEHQSSAADVDRLKAYIGYLLGDGQKLLPELNYAPLPAALDTKAKAELDKLTS
jgi:phosphate transport system substrate-binding protein